ncbi:hypothetical protein [Bacillus safensis]|uniref:hypothetical protein n=2 Tax=Bacillus safensis TaxID=561879 RepID=UPI0019335E4D|nr:hypothetical protein [Bacillus safensis]QRF33908.1 hypothetical protein JNE45_08585 [Bacillus safensis]
MGITELIVAVVNAFLEREKVKQDDQRVQAIINAINGTIIENRHAIEEALKDYEVNRLTGLYFGQIENFKEYDPVNSDKQILDRIAFDTNSQIVGPLINLYNNENDVERVRKIVKLMVLVVSLRALVSSELKYKHNDNRDDHILEQLRYVSTCCLWLKTNQSSRHTFPAMEEWQKCEREPRVGTVCLGFGEKDPLRDPTICCSGKFFIYKKHRDLFHDDVQQLNKVEEAINLMQGTFLLEKIVHDIE